MPHGGEAAPQPSRAGAVTRLRTRHRQAHGFETGCSGRSLLTAAQTLRRLHAGDLLTTRRSEKSKNSGTPPLNNGGLRRRDFRALKQKGLASNMFAVRWALRRPSPGRSAKLFVGSCCRSQRSGVEVPRAGRVGVAETASRRSRERRAAARRQLTKKRPLSNMARGSVRRRLCDGRKELLELVRSTSPRVQQHGERAVGDREQTSGRRRSRIGRIMASKGYRESR
jgi:hypothetical protein